MLGLLAAFTSYDQEAEHTREPRVPHLLLFFFWQAACSTSSAYDFGAYSILVGAGL